MTDWDFSKPWYHGSQQELTHLHEGSSITQDKDIARIFSHRPQLVSMTANGSLKHNGTTPGYLYLVSEALGPADVYPHPHPVNARRWEWLTKRQLQVQLVEITQACPDELLSAEEIAALKRKQQEYNALSFVEEQPDTKR